MKSKMSDSLHQQRPQANGVTSLLSTWIHRTISNNWVVEFVQDLVAQFVARLALELRLNGLRTAVAVGDAHPGSREASPTPWRSSAANVGATKVLEMWVRQAAPSAPSRTMRSTEKPRRRRSAMKSPVPCRRWRPVPGAT